MPAPARESGRSSVLMGLLVLAACLGLVVVSGGVGFAPTEVMIAGRNAQGAQATRGRPRSAPRRSDAPALASTRALAPTVVPLTREPAQVRAAPAVLPAVELTRVVATGGLERVRAKTQKQRARRTLQIAETEVAAGPAPTGRLNIITLNGWADVYLGPKKLGTTPGQFELPHGTHTLTLREGGAGVAQPAVVQIVEGQVSRARITLRR